MREGAGDDRQRELHTKAQLHKYVALPLDFPCIVTCPFSSIIIIILVQHIKHK